jgi:hypothetical protein
MQAIDIKYTREFLAGDTVGIGWMALVQFDGNGFAF